MFQDVLWFFQGNWDTICLVLVSALALAESVVRLTPTQSDDGAVTRIGQMVDKLLAVVPNNVKRKSPDEAFKK